MNEMLDDKLGNFSKSLIKLEKALKETGYALSIDGTLQRFEFTFEMAWKALKKFLLIEGYDCFSPRDCIKKAYQSGYIENEKEWLDMMKDRNLTSHLYDEKLAGDIYKRVKNIYVFNFEKLENFLKNRILELK